jgi:hypothetical protein
MPKLVAYDTALLAETLRAQHDVISRHQARACGLTPEAIRHRIRPEGPWQVVLPGIYLDGTGKPAAGQRAAAAFLHAGNALAVTGPAAVAWWGIPCRPGEVVDVLVPPECRRASIGFARLHRTKRIPNSRALDGAVRYVQPQRAVADAARLLGDAREARAVVAAAVQRDKVAIWQLADELAVGQRAGSARLRQVLAEVADGIRSVAEADLRALIKQARLPEPLYNARLYVGRAFLACPDAWWPEYGVTVEVDSMAWHLSPGSYQETQQRQARMVAEGIQVLPVAPRIVHSAGWKVGRQIRSALDHSRGPLAHITTVPGGRQVA